MKIKIDKLKIKKIIVIIIVSIIVLVVFKNLYEFFIQYDGKLDKSNPMNKEEILELLYKGINNNNYSKTIYIKDKDYKCEQKVFVKDNIVKHTLNGKEYLWKDYVNEEIVSISDFPEALVLKNVSMNMYSHLIQKAYNFASDEENYCVEYLGEKDFNGRRTILIKIYFKDDYENRNKIYEKFFIDKETGVEVNNISFSYNYKLHCLKRDYSKQIVEFGTTTDEDVKRPNLSGLYVQYIDGNNE